MFYSQQEHVIGIVDKMNSEPAVTDTAPLFY